MVVIAGTAAAGGGGEVAAVVVAVAATEVAAATAVEVVRGGSWAFAALAVVVVIVVFCAVTIFGPLGFCVNLNRSLGCRTDMIRAEEAAITRLPSTADRRLGSQNYLGRLQCALHRWAKQLCLLGLSLHDMNHDQTCLNKTLGAWCLNVTHAPP